MTIKKGTVDTDQQMINSPRYESYNLDFESYYCYHNFIYLLFGVLIGLISTNDLIFWFISGYRFIFWITTYIIIKLIGWLSGSDTYYEYDDHRCIHEFWDIISSLTGFICGPLVVSFINK
jgi:hypothetical protein